MKSAELRDAICLWLRSIGHRAIHAYGNAPAPKGAYIAVYTQGTAMHGTVMRPGADGGKMRCAQLVDTVRLYEVDGDGDALRDIRERLEQEGFDDFMRTRFPDGDGRDNSVAVWGVGDIADNSSRDGDFWIPQKTMSFEIQYNDWTANPTERMSGVEGRIGGENFEANTKE